MNNKTKKSFIVSVTVILTFGFSVSLQSLLAAWSNPTATPPAENISAPINVSSIGQLKKAGLVLNGGATGETTQNGLVVLSGKAGFGTADPKSLLDVNGEIRVGKTTLLCNNETAGAIRFNNANNRMYYCNGTVWKLFSTDVPFNQFVTYNSEPDYIQEDLKQSCVKFVVDVANTSGHFTNISGTAQTIGAGNTCSKIVAGTRFLIGSEWFNISYVTGNGSANGNVMFTGTKGVGSYFVNSVYASKISDGVVKLNESDVSLFGDGTYSGNIIQGGSVLQPVNGVITVTGTATVAPDPTTGASVVMCDSLVVDGASAVLQPSTNSKGLIIYARTGVQVKNGGRVNIDKLGKAGNFGNLTAYDLTPASLKSKVDQVALADYVVQGEGAAGANGISGSSVPGLPGSSAVAGSMKSGGGGSGASGCCGASATGKGGKGGPCAGGAGSGGTHRDWAGTANAGDYGGPGSNGSVSGGPGTGGGGAGNPYGAGAFVAGGNASGPTTPTGAGGGLLMMFSPSVLVGAGSVISSDGAMGGAGTNGSATLGGGGSAGGGIVAVVTQIGGYTNNGTVRANGGPASFYASTPTAEFGGAGGNGSVNIFTTTAGIPTNIYTTTITANSLDSGGWSGMSPATIAETPNSAKNYYSISFDNKNSFKVYNSGWRTIASNKNSDHGGVDGDWYYRDNANNWSPAYDNSANAAISQAAASTNNQMNGTSFGNISSVNWVSANGFVPGQTNFDVAVTQYSTNKVNNPKVDQIVLNVN